MSIFTVLSRKIFSPYIGYSSTSRDFSVPTLQDHLIIYYSHYFILLNGDLFVIVERDFI